MYMKHFAFILIMASLFSNTATLAAPNDMLDLIQEGESILTIKQNLRTFRRYSAIDRTSYGMPSNDSNHFFATYRIGRNCVLSKIHSQDETPQVINAGARYVFYTSIKNDSDGTVTLVFEKEFRILSPSFLNLIHIQCNNGYLNAAGTFTGEVEDDLGGAVEIDISPRSRTRGRRR